MSNTIYNRRILVVLLVLSLVLVNLVSIIAMGFKRHGEDVEEVPLAIPVDELTKLADSGTRIISSKNLTALYEILDVLEALRKIDNTSNVTFYSSILYEYLNNTSIPWMSRFDYIGLSVLASIESIYNNVAIIDPVRLTLLLKKYEENRIEWLLEKIRERYPLLAEYIDKYNNEKNETIRKTLLDQIRRILLKIAENGEIDVLMLASEALNTTTSLGFTIDRIKLAEYLNTTARALEKYNASGIARIIRLMKTMSYELYRGEITSAWQYLSVLKEEVLKLNITLDFEDAIRLSSIISITGITVNGAFMNTGSLRTTSAVVADILASSNYNVKFKATSILANMLSKNNEGERRVSFPLQSFKALTSLLTINQSETGLEMLALKQPLVAKSTKYNPSINVMNNPMMFTVIVSISAIVAGIIFYSTIRLPPPKTSLIQRGQYFDKIPFREDAYSRTIIEYYMKALKILSSKGYPRFYWETPREHLLKLEGTSCYEPFSRIVELYEKTVFAEEQVIVGKEFLEELLEMMEKCT